MNTNANLKPIETVYNGYRFRSRLEARWAVFFDALNIKWSYEEQGFDLDGERYLPDFYLHEHNSFIEIKGENVDVGYRTPRIYMAGRMGSANFRDFDIDHSGNATDIKPVYRKWRGVSFEYCGPFSINEKAHTGEHGNAFREYTFERCLAGIDRCDVFLAYIGDREAFGTLVEIGYASAKGKKLVVGVDCSLNYGGDPEAEIKDLWFAAQAADQVFTGNRDCILSQFASFLKKNFDEPREIRLAERLSKISGEGVCLFYGDPFNLFERAWWGFGNPKFGHHLKKLPRDAFKSAALIARQARFEHGQSGAR